MRVLIVLMLAALLQAGTAVAAAGPRATGDLGLVVERASGALTLVDTTRKAALDRIEGLGDLSHASIVFSRDERYAYVFGRDGGLTKVDLLTGRIDQRRVQAGNSIGGAISQDGSLIAVSNYDPGGVNVFRADNLEPVAEIPAIGGNDQRSKVVGLVDAPGQKFVFSLYDAGEIWIADFSSGTTPAITRFRDIGKQPYDALITPEGRYYIAGLFGEDGLVLLDLWNPDNGPQRILNGYGRGEKSLPVYKMPHLEGWAMAGRYAFLPAVGHHELLVLDTHDWRLDRRIPLAGQPVFAVARPDKRRIWINFAPPNNDRIQIVDVASMKIVAELEPGDGVLHIEFTPRGESAWVSVRDENRIDVYDTESLERISTIPVNKPSGIFFTVRAHKIGL